MWALRSIVCGELPFLQDSVLFVWSFSWFYVCRQLPFWNLPFFIVRLERTTVVRSNVYFCGAVFVDQYGWRIRIGFSVSCDWCSICLQYAVSQSSSWRRARFCGRSFVFRVLLLAICVGRWFSFVFRDVDRCYTSFKIIVVVNMQEAHFNNGKLRCK